MTKEEALRKVKGYLVDYLPFDTPYSELDEIMEALEQQPSWISVKDEEKPKEGQEVLTIYEGYYEGQYFKDRARCYYANGGIAFESLESRVWKYSISRIRAWMPIPEYEEGD